jgi:hypothetical protein
MHNNNASHITLLPMVDLATARTFGNEKQRLTVEVTAACQEFLAEPVSGLFN